MIQLESQSKPEKSFSGELPGDIVWFMTDSDDESDLLAKFQIGEGRVEEKMQELYQEITCSYGGDNHAPPYPPPPTSFPSPPMLSSSSAAVGLQGESCGAALSAAVSSVMAGVELVAPASASSATRKLNARKAKQGDIGGGDDGDGDFGAETTGMKMDGSDGSDEGGDELDQWLTKVLALGPLDLLEEWDSSK